MISSFPKKVSYQFANADEIVHCSANVFTEDESFIRYFKRRIKNGELYNNQKLRVSTF